MDRSSIKPSLSQNVPQYFDNCPYDVRDQYLGSAKGTLGTHGADNKNLVLVDLGRLPRGGHLQKRSEKPMGVCQVIAQGKDRRGASGIGKKM